MAVSMIAKLSTLASVGKGLYKRNQKVTIGEVLVDCTTLDVITQSNVITQHPVQDGYTISDHAFSLPLRYKIEGRIVDSSSDILGVVTSAFDLFKGNLFENIKNRYAGKGRNQMTSFEALSSLADDKAVVDVVSYWKTYSNMMIENIEFPKDSRTGACLHFIATLQQLKTADVKYVDISHNSKPVQDLVSNKVSLGKKQTLTPTEEQRRGVSVPKNLINQAIKLYRGQ